MKRESGKARDVPHPELPPQLKAMSWHQAFIFKSTSFQGDLKMKSGHWERIPGRSGAD